MFNIMGNHYENIKESVGIRQVFEAQDTDDETDLVFQKLRPQSPYKFRELVRNEFDEGKYTKMVGANEGSFSKNQVKEMILQDRSVDKMRRR